jgi:hypothetical protein
VRAEIKAFRLVSAVLAYCLLSSTVATHLLHSVTSHPFYLCFRVEKVAPPINAGGFLYDTATGAILYDSVTGAPLYA